MAYVLIESGIVIQKQPNEQDGFIEAPDHVICGWLFDGSVVTAPTPPALEPTPPHLNYEGLVRFTAGNPATTLENIRVGPVIRLAKGRFRIAHEFDMGTDQYSVIPSVMDPSPRSVRGTARTSSTFEIRCTDAAGQPADAQEITVNIKRVIE
jgi:hypothetical protein